MRKFSFDRVCVVGLGYIGLPTAAILAQQGVKVIGVDVNEKVVDLINSGEIHIVEPGLGSVVKECVATGCLQAQSSPDFSDVFLISVPTPLTLNSKQPDLSFVESAARSVAHVLRPGNLVILESTSPVGTTERLSAWMAEERPELTFPHSVGINSDIRVAYCPERALPGATMEELVANERVIGGITTACFDLAAEFYALFVSGNCASATSSRVAEMVKLCENSFRDVNIAFANELSLMCDLLDINVWELIALANKHPRVNILQPGPGVGGHCIAVDPWFLSASAPEVARLIPTARGVNDAKPLWVMNKLKVFVDDFLNQHPHKKRSEITIAIYGIAFKADTGDLRESPALEITRNIVAEHPGAVQLVEPNIDVVPEGLGVLALKEIGQVTADIHVLLVDHKEFRASRPSQGVVIDFRGVWS